MMWFRLALLPLSAVCALMVVSLSQNMEAQGNPALMGRWSFLPDLAYTSPHAHVLPNGKVLVWPLVGSGQGVHSWDPATGVITALAAPGFDLFCSGHVYLADGRLLVVGGHIEIGVGLPNAATYDSFNNLWTGVPKMNAGRWYPTATLLGDGNVLVTSGTIDYTEGENTLPQVLDVASNTWRDLTNSQLLLDLYPRMHLAPNGRVFNSGPNYTSRYLDTSGTGAWSAVANHVVDVYRDTGQSVMYEPGKVLVMGGGDPATNTAEVIDLTSPTPAWRQIASMAFSRRHANTQILPDGKVFVSGGTAAANRAQDAALASEMWNPATEGWTTMASQLIPRLYHSAAVLLPDGRVLSLGGDMTTQTEVYEPPYLFNGPRPTVSSAPETVSHGQNFFVGTPDAAGISQVTLVSLSSPTHAFDMNQRFNRLSFSSAAGGVNVTAPASGNIAPPGYYWLFVLNGNGVPSVGKAVRLTSGPSNAPNVSALSPSTALAGGPGFTLTINGSNFAAGAVARWNGSARPTTVVDATQLTVSIPASDITTAGDAQVSVLNPGGAVSNAVTFETTDFTVTPVVTAPARTVTATWGGLTSPAASNWIGLYVQGAPDSEFLDWMYVSCSKTPGAARASGSCPFPLPSSLAFGAHQLRLFASPSSGLLTASNYFTVETGAEITASPTAIPIGGTVTATWSGIVNPTAADWIGLFRPGSSHALFLHYIYVSCSDQPGTARASGSCPMTVPADVPPGNYQLRIFSNNTYDHLNSSNSFTIGVSPGTLHFSSPTYSVSEGGANATITVQRSGGNNGVVGATFATSNGTATSPGDYTGVTQTVSFANADSAPKTITIPITNDGVAESSETVNLALTSPTGGATLASPSTAVLTITDGGSTGPGTVQFSAGTYSVSEGGGTATITVTRTGGSTGAVGATVATTNGTATAPADYTTTSQTVTFAAGDTAPKTVTVPIADDQLEESSETVNLALGSPTGGVTLGGPSSAVLTIADNDSAPAGTLQFSSGTYTAGEGAGTATITVTRAGGSAGAVGVTIGTVNGTATAPADYAATSQAVSFAAGDTAPKTVSVPLNDDQLVEGNETVNLALSSPTGGATLGSPGTAVLTITDNDAAGPVLTVNPMNVTAGGSVTATFNTPGTADPWDRLALYPVGAGDGGFLDWFYTGDCSKTRGVTRTSGSCTFTNLTTGTFEVRVFFGPNTASDGSAGPITVTSAPAGTLQFSTGTYNVNEAGGNATITVTRTGGSAGAVGVTVGTTNGTATAPADYAALSQTVSFAAGDTAPKTVTVTIEDDQLVEGSETVNLALANPTGGATLGSPVAATLTIADNDVASPGTVQFSAATYSAGEGAGTVTITVSRTGGSAGAIGVTLATANGTATAPADYTATSQTVSFAAGDAASKTVSITISDDELVEGSETVSLALGSPTGGATLGSPATAVLTITDNDVAASGTLQFSAGTYSVGEGGGSATITVTRTGGSAGAVGATVSTANGTATAPGDYTATSQTVTFGAGDTAPKTVSVTISDDQLVESSETVGLALSNPTGGATLGSPTTAVLTITDNDVAGTVLSVNPTTVAAGGSVTATFNTPGTADPWDRLALYPVGAGDGGFLDWYYTGNCSKTRGATRTSGTCTFTNLPAGTLEVRIFFGSDTASDASAGPISVTSGGPGTLQFSAATYSVGEGAGTATITVTRAGGSTGAVGVTLATTNGSATAPADYTATSQTVSFAAGDTAPKTVSIPINNDQLVESSETVNLALSTPTGGATLGSPATAVLTITDNDSASPLLSVSPSSVPPGGSVTATFNRPGTADPWDRVAIYPVGASDNGFLDWFYTGNCSKTRGATRTSGSCTFTNLNPGTIEVRIFLGPDTTSDGSAGPVTVSN